MMSADELDTLDRTDIDLYLRAAVNVARISRDVPPYHRIAHIDAALCGAIDRDGLPIDA